MNLAITQFMRPNGREKVFDIIIPDRFKDKVELLGKLHCKITAEQLINGKAAQYITHESGDMDIRVTPCGGKADEALMEMLDNFSQESFETWLIENKE